MHLDGVGEGGPAANLGHPRRNLLPRQGPKQEDDEAGRAAHPQPAVGDLDTLQSNQITRSQRGQIRARARRVGVDRIRPSLLARRQSPQPPGRGRRVCNSWLTMSAFALPLDIFMTAPTKAPSARSLPAW